MIFLGSRVFNLFSFYLCLCYVFMFIYVMFMFSSTLGYQSCFNNDLMRSLKIYKSMRVKAVKSNYKWCNDFASDVLLCFFNFRY